MSGATISSALRDGVRRAYSQVAVEPSGEHPFPVGRQFAENLGYPPDLLDSLPATIVEAFAGVSSVSIFADIPVGTTVLDLGCGAGLDTFIAARRVGAEGKVIGVDFSSPMIARAQRAAAASEVGNVTFLQAGGEQLPIRDETIDVVLVNGIFNLNPARDLIFRELARVVCPGGMAFAAELILREPLAEEEQTPSNWFA